MLDQTSSALDKMIEAAQYENDIMNTLHLNHTTQSLQGEISSKILAMSDLLLVKTPLLMLLWHFSGMWDTTTSCSLQTNETEN